ncbi:MAG: glycosyltransferase family 4 protein [Flavobacteriaceae bacterium]
MKVDFIISSLQGGGAERVMVIMAKHLASIGYKIRIIVFADLIHYDLPENISLEILDKKSAGNHLLRSVINLRRFYGEKENRPDLMVSFITKNNLIAILVSKLRGIPLLACEHSNFFRNQSPIFLSKLTKTFFYRFVDQLTVLTNFDLPYYGKYGIKAKVLPNPATFEPIREIENKRKKTILAVGGLDRYHIKGFDNLIEIMEPVLKSNKDWKLKFVGGGEKGKAFLLELAKERQIDESVIFTGFREDVADIMKESDIFVLSSRIEGMPMVLLEAMSQGMACIAYDCKTGPADIIESNFDGLLIEDQNIEAMSSGLQMMINDEDLRKRLRTNAVKSVAKFSIESIGEKWVTLLKEVVEKR